MAGIPFQMTGRLARAYQHGRRAPARSLANRSFRVVSRMRTRQNAAAIQPILSRGYARAVHAAGEPLRQMRARFGRNASIQNPYVRRRGRWIPRD